MDALGVLLYVCGLVFVLWGLKIFKIYIVTIGIITGALIGAVIGAIASMSSGDPNGLYIGAAVGAVIGGIIALPLEKIMFFLAGGGLGAVLGIAIAVAVGSTESNVFLGFGIGGFLLGGIVALALHDFLVIILLSFQGAFVMTIAYNIQEWSTLVENISRYGFDSFDYLIDSLSFIIIPVLIAAVIYAIFGWILQKVYGFKKNDTTNERRLKEGFKYTAYVFAALSIITFAARTSQDLLVGLITQLSLYSWPFFVLITFAFIRLLDNEAVAGVRIGSFKILQVCGTAAVAVLILPVVAFLVDAFVVYIQLGRSEIFSSFTPYMRQSHFWLFSRTEFFGSGVVLFKWLYTFLILPGILYLLVQHRGLHFRSTGTSTRTVSTSGTAATAAGSAGAAGICSNCGYANLTSFDRVCPGCKKPV
jgi:hypothetical protein